METLENVFYKTVTAVSRGRGYGQIRIGNYATNLYYDPVTGVNLEVNKMNAKERAENFLHNTQFFSWPLTHERNVQALTKAIQDAEREAEANGYAKGAIEQQEKCRIHDDKAYAEGFQAAIEKVVDLYIAEMGYDDLAERIRGMKHD